MNKRLIYGLCSCSCSFISPFSDYQISTKNRTVLYCQQQPSSSSEELSRNSSIHVSIHSFVRSFVLSYLSTYLQSQETLSNCSAEEESEDKERRYMKEYFTIRFRFRLRFSWAGLAMTLALMAFNIWLVCVLNIGAFEMPSGLV